jgi:hypothetical protein
MLATVKDVEMAVGDAAAAAAIAVTAAFEVLTDATSLRSTIPLRLNATARRGILWTCRLAWSPHVVCSMAMYSPRARFFHPPKSETWPGTRTASPGLSAEREMRRAWEVMERLE